MQRWPLEATGAAERNRTCTRTQHFTTSPLHSHFPPPDTTAVQTHTYIYTHTHTEVINNSRAMRNRPGIVTHEERNSSKQMKKVSHRSNLKERTVFEGNKCMFVLKWRRKGHRVHRRECWDRMSDGKCVNTDRALNGRALTGDTFWECVFIASVCVFISVHLFCQDFLTD